ncbi:Uncharacterised protein [Yersinia aleksiciae]|uniref:Uncharacterized protein n=1 Tax=Yersinia aleksiciae TaxID=263819 RepID=A0A0T9UT60_YERAE|nr:Uncharacterised protein [Yersinia aleksiciae]CNL69254.1 Uncharacterised protein [Yersinia aleksiciae]
MRNNWHLSYLSCIIVLDDSEGNYKFGKYKLDHDRLDHD